MIAVSASLSFTACEDYLTVDSPDDLTSQSFWRDIIADCKDWTLDDEEAETETT